MDVSKEEDVAAIFDRFCQKVGYLDVAFNCAGISSTKGIYETDTSLWDKIMAVNARGTYYSCKYAMKMMQAQKAGRIINVSSISGQIGSIRTSPAYAASKAAILSITMSFAKLGAPDGVLVNAVSPGLVNTDMTRDKDFHYSADEVPLGRAAAPEEIANVVLFLASGLNTHITGQCISVNGGMLFH